jgi:hypothetical protein
MINCQSEFSISIMSTSMTMSIRSPDGGALIAMAGIGYRREAFAKFRLLALRFPLFVYLPRLLLGTRT